MLSWQVGRVKITRIVEMDLPVPAGAIPDEIPCAIRGRHDDAKQFGHGSLAICAAVAG